MIKYFFATFFFLSVGISYTQSDAKIQMIQDELQIRFVKGQFNGVALVIDGGQELLHQSYGYSDVDCSTELNLSDKFYIGSLTKQFVATCVLYYYGDGRLPIDESIGNFLPEFDSTKYDGVYVRHLLNHTSGFDNYTAFTEFDRSIDYSRDEMIQIIKSHPKEPVLKRWNYSNSGYYLLGLILEEVSGKSLNEVLEEILLKKADMKNSGYDSLWLNNGVASGSVMTIEGRVAMPDYSLQTLFSSGGMYSTAEDLKKWNQALYSGEILCDSLMQILHEPILNDYACGWYVKRGIENGEAYERHFHGGLIQGYHSFVLNRIKENQLIVLLDNHNSPYIQSIKNNIWRILVDEPVREIPVRYTDYLRNELKSNRDVSWLSTLNVDSVKLVFDVNEGELNSFGYRLMSQEHMEEAGAIFELILRWFPNSWNAYDSFGEYLYVKGDFEGSRKYYLRSIELNPSNDSGRRQLLKIEQKKSLRHAKGF